MLANQIEISRFPPDKKLIEELLEDKEVKERLGMAEACQDTSQTRVQLLATAVRIDPAVLPKLAATFSRLKERQAVEGSLEAYVFQHPAINAFVTKERDHTLVAISSSAINDLSDREMDFLIGHELGHAIHGHIEIAIGSLAEAGELAPTKCMRMRAWQRAAEISADRAGLLCCGSVDVAATALFKTISGLHLEDLNVSPAEFAGQWDHLCEEVVDAGERDQWQLSHPFPPLRMKAMTSFWSAITSGGGEHLTTANEDAERMLAMMDPTSEGEVLADPLLAGFFFWGGLYIAFADGHLDPKEIKRLQGVAPPDVDLRPEVLADVITSERCLAKFKQGIEGRRKKLSAVELHRIIYGLIDVAAADGHIDGDEVKRLHILGEVLGIQSNGCDLIVEKYKKEAL
jgi:uncharacterized tellurite resistance protein B-like protein